MVRETGERNGLVFVLVVDDETVRDVVCRYLEVAGFLVEVAGGGGQALARFAAHRPDLVVLDVMMPGIGASTCAGDCGRPVRCPW